MHRLALYGPRGAGKSTVSSFLVGELGDKLALCHSAAPLYEMQSSLYGFAGKSIGGVVQDGRILAGVATLLRSLNPDALADYVVEQAEAISMSKSEVAVFLCDDTTPADRHTLTRHGFVFLHITAPASLRRQRRISRGDVSSQHDGNDPDVPLSDPSDLYVVNDGTIEELILSVFRTLEGAGIDFGRHGD